MQYKVFGCKVNKYYTDSWLHSDYLRDKSGVFVASCVVTDSAKRKWVRFVKKALRDISGKEKIYISGCGAFKDGKAQSDFFDLYPELAEAQEKIEILDESPQPPTSISASEKPPVINDIPLTEGEGVKRNGDGKMHMGKLKKLKTPGIYTKKFILIQGGCDSFCTFCLTVQKRGRHYYRAKQDIAQEIQAFADSGGKEVVLTGVNLSAWGLPNTHDIRYFSPSIIKNGTPGGGESRLGELLSYIIKHTTIPRLRISSLGPEFITDEVLNVFEHERMYPHFHYSVQSGSSKILKSMARHYDGAFIRDILQKTKNITRKDGVDVSLGADIIVGFPGEDEDDFMDTYTLVQDSGITKLHAFLFSAHTLGESVPAGSFKNQVPEKIKKERMDKLLTLGEQNRQMFLENQRGKELQVLIEKYDPKGKDSLLSWSGWTQNYLEANETNFEIVAGKLGKNEIVTGRFL